MKITASLRASAAALALLVCSATAASASWCNPVIDTRGTPVVDTRGNPVIHEHSYQCAETQSTVETKRIAEHYMVFFDWNKAALKPEAVGVLKQVAANAKAGKPTVVAVEGHTDRSGPEAYNQGLSERRAAAVADALRQMGVPSFARGFGETRPLIPTADGVREPHNRRVEITVGE